MIYILALWGFALCFAAGWFFVPSKRETWLLSASLFFLGWLCWHEFFKGVAS